LTQKLVVYQFQWIVHNSVIWFERKSLICVLTDKVMKKNPYIGLFCNKIAEI
jgi:hypothetical protein